ncbi:putative membrane protein YesL [Nonomuraea thailandensis]|uniref:Membrane protein YesL n=1 Tax=Nonomuraea thailandensis TaxID=1188745 RepID=A0A9X2GM44_9ACTN|nr:YesL family protein [Nonomuraea thailandensis]MCP2360282.1 putative membrane protein YesL [Nonomuraea thailandensis]
MGDVTTSRQFGSGPLSRISALIYTLLVVELLVLLTAVPGLVALVLLDRSAGNVPLMAACLLPAGPALSAALYALRHRGRELTELRPAPAFWRGYRLNFGAAMKIWVPWLVVLALVGTNLGNFSAAGVPGWWAALLVVLAAGATLWVANALVITSLFAFRAVDVAKLAAYSLGRFPGATLANTCLLIVAGGVTVLATEAAPALLASVLTATLLWNSRAMITEVQQRFTRQ